VSVTDHELAETCARAYLDFTYCSPGGVEVLVEEHPSGALIVAPRGTEKNYQDILRDMWALPWWDRRLGWCHAGFLWGARSVWSWFVNSGYLYRPDQIYFTGPSLGGAMATILAAQVTTFGDRPPAGLVTFGSPKVTMSDRIERILAGVPISRYVRGADIVPTVPTLLPWWRHVGEATTLEGEGHPFHDHRMGGTPGSKGYVEALA
jgi:predicted lipase